MVLVEAFVFDGHRCSDQREGNVLQGYDLASLPAASSEHRQGWQRAFPGGESHFVFHGSEGLHPAIGDLDLDKLTARRVNPPRCPREEELPFLDLITEVGFSIADGQEGLPPPHRGSHSARDEPRHLRRQASGLVVDSPLHALRHGISQNDHVDGEGDQGESEQDEEDPPELGLQLSTTNPTGRHR